MSREFLFLVASTRRDGNAERLARAAAAELPSSMGQRWLRLDEFPLEPFVDHRHDGVGYADPSGHALTLAQATLAATDLVFVTPVYWYSLPADAKRYLDHWSAWLRAPSLDFKARMKGKALWAAVVDSSEPEDRAFEPLDGLLVRTADYMGMRWAGALHAHANRPGELPATALEEAKRWLVTDTP